MSSNFTTDNFRCYPKSKMFREDIIFLIPALFIALYQVKFIWNKLPQAEEHETEILGEYTNLHRVLFSYLKSLGYSIFLLQLIFPILEITFLSPNLLRISGYMFIISGFIVSLTGIKALGFNWTGMHEYRIKKGQQLVTKEIYKVIRHPIYLAVILEVVGFELVARSWLVIPFLIISFWIFHHHIKKEEKLLELKFGQDFIQYKNTTKKLIPFLF